MSDFLKKPIIFCGIARSGTTIISETICQHRDLAWPSNYQKPFPTLTSINYLRRVFDNKYWRVVGKKHSIHGSAPYNRILFRPDENYNMWRHLVGKEPNFGREFLLSETAPPELRQTIRHYFAKLVIAQGRKRLAFKHTGPPKIGYLLSIFPDAVFINIRRSAIPTINSLLNTKFWRAGGSQQLYWTGPYSSEEERWVNDNKNHPELITALQVKKVSWAEQTEIELHKPNILTVNYETFTVAPRREVERILDFCGLPDDPKTNEYLLNNPIVQRNLPDESYFETDVLKELYGVLNNFQ